MIIIDQFERSIRSTVAEAASVHRDIICLLEKYHAGMCDSVRVCLEEGLSNALMHGNCLNPEKLIHIVCQIDMEGVEIVIEDEGHGFPIADVPDPADDENVFAGSGRGIMMMRAFMSSVEYNQTGNRVVMQKRAVDTNPSG